MKKKIFINVDGFAQIGLGHLIRSQVLGGHLSPKFEVEFLVSGESSGHIDGKKIQHRIIDKSNLKQEFEALRQAADAEKGVVKILVLDGYRFDLAYQKHARKIFDRVVLINDFALEEMAADAYICPTSVHDSMNQENFPGVQIGQGLDFNLVRPEFHVQNGRPSEQRLEAKQVKEIFLNFGGFDAMGLVAEMQACLPKFFPGAHFTWVKAGGPPISAQEMADKMLACDLAVLSASGVAIEAACLRVPNFIIDYMDNQRFLAGYLQGMGCCHRLGPISKENWGKDEREALSDRIALLVQAPLKWTFPQFPASSPHLGLFERL